MTRKLFLSGACAAVVVSGVAITLWYTRYRIPEEVHLEVEHRPKTFVLPQGNQWCQTAMSIDKDDYVRPVFKLVSSGETLSPTIKLRDSDVSQQDLPTYLEGMFKTRAQRTVFLLTSRQIAPRYLDDVLHVIRSSPFVDEVCVMDSQALPPWFPKSPEPRGRE